MKLHALASVTLLLFAFVLACSAQSPTEVLYVHMAFTGNPTEMVFSWYTQNDTDTSVCQVGLDRGVYTFNGTGSSTYWKLGYGYMHHALVSDLSALTQYHYICGDEEGGFSSDSTFTTAPDDDIPFTIGVYGDMGTDRAIPTIDRINDLAKRNHIDWVFHVGDISYADDHPDFQHVWNRWAELIDPTTIIKPYMTMPGNHEFIAQFTPELWTSTDYFKVYNARFNMPSAQSNSSTNMWYSFDYSNVHFVAIDTETDYPGAVFGDHFGDQLAWLENDLQTATSSPNRKPWIIVGGHRPMYSSDVSQSNATTGAPKNSLDNSAKSIQESFEELFHKYGVDLFFVGHIHSYERTYPVYQNVVNSTSYVNPQGLTEVVIGCAGNIEGLEDKNPKHWNDPQPAWSAYRYGDGFGYGLLDIYNSTTLRWSFYKSEDNSLLDGFVIQKDQ